MPAKTHPVPAPAPNLPRRTLITIESDPDDWRDVAEALDLRPSVVRRYLPDGRYVHLELEIDEHLNITGRVVARDE